MVVAFFKANAIFYPLLKGKMLQVATPSIMTLVSFFFFKKKGSKSPMPSHGIKKQNPFATLGHYQFPRPHEG